MSKRLQRPPVVGIDRVEIEVVSEHPVYRRGSRDVQYQSGDVVLWTDHLVHLHQAGDIQPVRIDNLPDLPEPEEPPAPPAEAHRDTKPETPPEVPAAPAAPPEAPAAPDTGGGT